MADFDVFLPLLLQFEGGYVNDSEDPGGETNKGITLRTFQQCAHHLLGIEPSSDNLKALTDAQAGILYRSLYWERIHGDDIALQELANIVCDFYVNAGTHATALLQQVINQLGGKVVVDGAIGNASLQALAALDATTVYRQYKQGRIDYYQSLGQQYPRFLQGWLNRVNAFPDI